MSSNPDLSAVALGPWRAVQAGEMNGQEPVGYPADLESSRSREISNIGQAENDRCRTRAMPGRTAALGAVFHRARGLIRNAVPGGLGMGIHLLTMTRLAIRRGGLHRQANDRRDKHQ